MKKIYKIVISIICTTLICSSSSLTFAAETNSKYSITDIGVTQEESDYILKLYQDVYTETNIEQDGVSYHPVASYSMGMAIGGISNLTFNDCFKNVSWITRSGVVSLSIMPNSKLLSSTGSNANAAKARADNAFALLKKKYDSSPQWRNTASLYAQFHCHVLGAGKYKTPWNIEPSVTETNIAKLILAKCNPR